MHPGTHRLTAIIGLALLSAGPADAQETKPLTIDDLGAIEPVGRPELSPDGSRAAYAFDDRIHVVPVDGGKPRAVTSAASSASSPRWSRDGDALYFLSDRDGSTQVWMLALDAFGEAEQVTRLERGVDRIEFSPDESRLLLSFDVESGVEPDSNEEAQPWVIDRLQFKEDAGDGYLTDWPQDELHVLDVASGDLRRLTEDRYSESYAAWSPDGREIVFVSNRDADPDRTYANDLWAIPAAGGKIRRVTNDARVESSPAYSPDGRTIAYLSAEDGVYGIRQLALVDAAGGEPRILSAGLDRWITDFRFSADGNWIYVRFDNHGGSHLARIRVRDGEIERLIEGERSVTAFDVDRRGNAVVRLSNANDAQDLYRRQGARLQRLTDANAEFFATRRLGAKTKSDYTLDDGTIVETFITVPPGYEAGTRLPAVLKIHGGPVGQFSWGYDFGTQFLAANGYVVLEPNPRGSTGRGQAFIRAIRETWGITDYPDVIGAVDHAIELGYADPDRLAVTGYSYGGYMTNVVITRSDRFDAAASGAGHSHIIANYGHDIYQKWYNWELGLPATNRESYNRLSPLLDADRVTTPTIFLGGREDWNVPILSAELFYQALRTRGIDTRLVVYPDSHHGGWDERFEKDYLERVVAWFGRHVTAD
ncbi:MAG: S9 family peptidase [Woeseiaceae bacterium]|nr:S9 family peptidase [Woeseiaceae bacterium]